MPSVRSMVTNAAVAGTVFPLGAFNRFGGNGGAVQVRGTNITAEAATLSLQIGSDIIVNRALLPVEAVAGQGPTKDTVAFGGVGGPGDPILVTVFGPGGTEDPTVQVDITNL